MKKIKLNLDKGFTLIEFLVFMSILSMLILVLSNVFSSIIDSQVESKAYSAVDIDGRYILSKLAYDFQSADSLHDSIVIPAPGASGNTLKININSVDYIYNSTGSANFQLAQNVGSIPDQLNSPDSSVSALLFQRIGLGGNNDTIRVSFTLTSRVLRHNIKESRNFMTTLSMP